MLLPIIVCPIISILFLFLAKYNKGYQAKPRLLSLSKNLLLDIPFSFTIISSANIISSTVISLQENSNYNALTLASSGIFCSLLVIQMLIYVCAQKHFKEYRNYFCTSKKLCCVSIQTSTKIRRFYPIILIL